MQFKKYRTAGLSQSNARKYITQYKLANQRKVSVTTRQKFSLTYGVECLFITANAAVLFLFFVLALSYKENLMKVYIMETIPHSQERFWKMYKESMSTEALDKNKTEN